MHAYVWDEIDNDLKELPREEFLKWLRSDESWHVSELHRDGTLEYTTDSGHIGFATYAKSMEDAHAKLLKHPRYLEFNETEA